MADLRKQRLGWQKQMSTVLLRYKHSEIILKKRYSNFQILGRAHIHLSERSPGYQAAGPQSPHCQMSESHGE